MPGLFDAPTGPAMPGSGGPVGSPGYSDAIVSNAERQLRPRYQKALQTTRQNFSDSGQLGGGLDKAAQLSLQESFLGDIGDVSERAGTRGADVAEENRRRLETRDWQKEDRDREIERLNTLANQQREDANRNMWANLISQGAMAVGTGGGSLLASYLANKARSAAAPIDTDSYDAGGINAGALDTAPY